MQKKYKFIHKNNIWSCYYLSKNTTRLIWGMFMVFKGPFKYYVIKEVGGWGQKVAIPDDWQYCKSSKNCMGGPKKVKNMMT